MALIALVAVVSLSTSCFSGLAKRSATAITENCYALQNAELSTPVELSDGELSPIEVRQRENKRLAERLAELEAEVYFSYLGGFDGSQQRPLKSFSG
jgi:hypothetical protein